MSSLLPGSSLVLRISYSIIQSSLAQGPVLISTEAGHSPVLTKETLYVYLKVSYLPPGLKRPLRCPLISHLGMRFELKGTQAHFKSQQETDCGTLSHLECTRSELTLGS